MTDTTEISSSAKNEQHQTHDGRNTEATTPEAEAAPSMELNLRLDENGRTTFDPTLVDVSKSNVVDASASCTDEDDSGKNGNLRPEKRARVEPEVDDVSIDYSSKTLMTNLHCCKLQEAMDSLLFDCEITDCGLLPRTFWIPSQGMEPRCFLEKLALEIFHHHVPQSPGYYYDPTTSGAEWWVQIRPSPPGTGRYSMLTGNDNETGDDDMSKSGISFHWDKDEDLRLLCGGSMYIHPHLSTVTYLTDIGAPTMVLSKRVDPMTGDNIAEQEDVAGLVCWPKRGKHLSFDGRYLHAAPSDLMDDGEFDRQCSFVADGMGDKEKKIQERRHRRVTFLVNVWLNYKPFNVNPFPETMLKSLSKSDLFGNFHLFEGASDNDAKQSNTTAVCIINGGATEVTENGKRSVEIVEKFWPMGACDQNDQIKVPMPLQVIRNQASSGSDIKLTWQANLIKLSDSA